MRYTHTDYQLWNSFTFEMIFYLNNQANEEIATWLQTFVHNEACYVELLLSLINATDNWETLNLALSEINVPNAAKSAYFHTKNFQVISCMYIFKDERTVTCTFVSTHVAHLRCGGPPSAGPSPSWWPTCGRPHAHAPSLPRPAGPSREAQWKTPRCQSGWDLPGKEGFQINAPLRHWSR